MKIVTKKIAELKPYAKNPRVNGGAVEAVAASIREFGFKVPIVIDGANVIVAGHTRYKAAKVLKLKTVPCIVADDLTDEQIRAFRLADNKTGELATWDFGLLADELATIDGLEMGDFGFELDMEIETGGFDWGDERGKYMLTKNLDNFFKASYEAAGSWGIPETTPFTENLGDIEWLSFGEKSNIRDPGNTGLHFFIDDYKFDAVWKSPDKWLPLFKECAAVVAADFSNYADMPLAMQIWNCYRRQWLARYWQDNGVNVISSLSWAQGQLFDWSFEGVPSGTTCATSFSCAGIDKEAAIDELVAVVEKVEPCKLYIKCGKKDAEALRKHLDFERIEVYQSRRKNAKRA